MEICTGVNVTVIIKNKASIITVCWLPVIMAGGDSMSVYDLIIMMCDIVATNNKSIIIAFAAMLLVITYVLKK